MAEVAKYLLAPGLCLAQRPVNLCVLRTSALAQVASVRAFCTSSRRMPDHSGFRWTAPKKTSEDLKSRVQLPEFYDGTSFTGPIPIEKLDRQFVCSGGAGGQNVNKVATKVKLSFRIEDASWLPKWIRHRLPNTAKTYINKQGVLTVASEVFRTQHENMKDATAKLENLIKDASKLPKERSAETEQRILKGMHRAEMHRLKEKKMKSLKKRQRNDFE